MEGNHTRGGVPRPARARLVRVLEDGREEPRPITDAIVIGRVEGEIVVPDDDFVSGRHAAVRREGGQFVLQDLGSTNGTYARVRSEIELRPGDYVLIGSQIFRFLV